MKKFAFAMALVALAAAPAVAGWTTYENSGSYDGYFWCDGEKVEGTWTWEYSYEYMANKNNSFYKGSSSWTFESFDGTVSASYKSSYNFKSAAGSANTYSSRGQHKVTYPSGTTVENMTFHYTFNANGELTSYHSN